jgi:hypothetical protein
MAALRHLVTWAIGIASMFFAGVAVIAFCNWVGLGETATALITVASSVAIGVAVIYFLDSLFRSR